MYLKFIILISLLLLSTANAQQADPVFLQRAITAVQTQRNLAMDTAAVAEAKLVTITEELTKAQAEIVNLKKQLEDKGK